VALPVAGATPRRYAKKMKILSTLLICVFAVGVAGCRKTEDMGKVDDWTWNAPELKARTSPDRSKRARADVEGGKVILKFGGVGGDHPVDIFVEHTENLPEPLSGGWEMEWLADSEFVFHRPDLGTKSWTVAGVYPMVVTVKRQWSQTPKS